MSLKRILLLGAIFAIAGWMAWAIFSLKQVGTPIPDLTLSIRPLAESEALAPVENPGDGRAVIEPQQENPREAADERVADTLEGSGVVAEPRKVPLFMRCNLHNGDGIYLSDFATFADQKGIFSAYTTIGDGELRVLADAGTDGFAQYYYAYHRLLGLLVLTPDEDEVSTSRLESRVDSPEDDLFKTAEHYFVEAIRNHNWIAANRLAAMYEPFDAIQARAWLLIEQEAGGKTLATREQAGAGLTYSAEEKSESEIRARALIDEFALGPGLLVPDECREELQ